MKRIIRLTESDLTRIVRRVISESFSEKLEIKLRKGSANITKDGKKTELPKNNIVTELKGGETLSDFSSDLLLIARYGTKVMSWNKPPYPSTAETIAYQTKKNGKDYSDDRSWVEKSLDVRSDASEKLYQQQHTPIQGAASR